MKGHEPKPLAISAGLKLQCNYNAGTDLIFYVNLKSKKKKSFKISITRCKLATQ